MEKYISSLGVKFIALLLSFTILFECNTMAFAGGIDFSKEGNTQFEESLSLFGIDESYIEALGAKLEEVYLKGNEGNIHEAALNRETSAFLAAFKAMPQRAALARLVKEGKAKYAANSPMYVKAAGSKDLAYLEDSLNTVLGSYFAKLSVMPFKDFEKLYKTAVKEAAEEYIAISGYETKVPYRSADLELVEQIISSYPAKAAYADYAKEAQASIDWRKANDAKVQEAAYKVIRAYIEGIGAENLSLPMLTNLINLELNGKKVINEAERKDIYEYSISHLEKQKLDLLEPSIFNGKKDKKIAAVLLKDLVETIVIGGYVSSGDNGRYAKAVENIIYKSEKGIGFSAVLESGFSALLGIKEYAGLRRILEHYTQKELEGASFGDYLSLTFYTSKIENANGRYLGKVSELTQYNTDYLYGNTFTDIALLLAEDGDKESIALLREYGVDKGIEGSIKPFLSGALISGKSSFTDKISAKLASDFANLSFGDISATQEYDIDKALLSKYPSVKANLGDGALINKIRLAAKQETKKNYAYLNRAAVSGDILILVWGTIGLVKLGGKALSLGRSAYTAIKAGRIANSAKRLAYIKANYAKLSKYISARNSLLKLSMRIKSGSLLKIGASVGAKDAGAANESRQALKLKNYFDQKQLGRLYQIRKDAVMTVRNSANPTKRQIAKADLYTAQYKAKQSQMSFLKKARIYGNSSEVKNTSYLQKVKDYNSNVSAYNSKIELLKSLKAKSAKPEVISNLENEIKTLGEVLNKRPAAPAYTAGELDYISAHDKFRASLSRFDIAKRNYKAEGWWQSNIVRPWNSLSSKGDGTLGLHKLETGNGITLAEALGIDRPYKMNYSQSFKFFGSKSADSHVNKLYSFLSKHNLKPLAHGIKFINNRATILGTTLLMNYNLATVTPEVINGGRTLAAGTELVINAGRSADAAAAISLSAGRSLPLLPGSLTPKPVNVIDPKILELFNAVPLPAGNMINSLGLKGLLGTAYKTGSITFASAALPLMLGKDFYKYFDRQILNLNPSAPAKIISPVFNFNKGFNSDFVQFGASNKLSELAAELGGWPLITRKSFNFVDPSSYVYEVPGIPHFSSSFMPYRTAMGTEPLTMRVFKDEMAVWGSASVYLKDMNERTLTMSVINAGGEEKMLPVKLSFHEDFNSKGYTNIVFNNNVAELREYGKTPRAMSNFFFRLKSENKSLIKFAKAVKESKENITVKLWQYGIEPSKTITVPLYYGNGSEELPIRVITDARFLQDKQKLVLTPSGNIGIIGENGYMPDILDSSVMIRIPKNQRNILIKILENSKEFLPLEVMPNYNKADVIIKEGFYINPSLGKTLGPVLPQSLGVNEAFATNLMYIVNYLPGLLSPLLNPLIKKYGEVAVFETSIITSAIAALLPALFGFWGHSASIDPTFIRGLSLTLSLFVLAFSINIRNVVGNSLINMNRGAMPIKKKNKDENKDIGEIVKITGQMMVDKFKKMFSSGTDFSMEDILYYNRSFINKNLGTMAFLIAPSVVNYGGRLFGFDFDFGWDLALPLYAGYSAYAGYKVHNTNLRDNKIIDHIKNDIYQMMPIADESNVAPGVADGAKKTGGAFSDIKEIFDVMLHKEGVLSIIMGMSLATAHELSVSSAFSSTLNQLIPDGDMATIMVIGVLYGALMMGRLLGNITTTRMSAGTSYLGYTILSAGGTAAIALGTALSESGLIISGGIIASIGIGNYFSQMFAYIIRKHPELQTQISQALSFTMPIAVGLSMPITYLNDWLGVPYARVTASLAMLVLSMMFTKGMLEDSTLYRYIVQEFKEASDYVIAKYKKAVSSGKQNNPGDTPTDMNNPMPN